MRIGFFYFHKVGDNILTFDALFAIKQIYNAQLFVFGNAIFVNLLECCDFVDAVFDIKNDIASHLDLINHTALDYAILPKCKGEYLKALIPSNVKKIIAPHKLSAIFSMRCKTPPLHTFLAYRKMSVRERILYIVSQIDSQLFNQHIATLDFKKSKIQTAVKHKQRIAHFFSSLKLDIQKYLILINPFNVATSYTLSINGYLALMEAVIQTQVCYVIVPTYPKVHQAFMEALKSYASQSDLISKILIFENDADLLNLAELISHVSCVISPSTGVIHLASNLYIPSIGIYHKGDLPKWKTREDCYVFLQKTMQENTLEDENKAIAQTLLLLKEKIDSNHLANIAQLFLLKTP